VNVLAKVGVTVFLCGAVAACGASNTKKVAATSHCYHFAHRKRCVDLPQFTAAEFRFVACVRAHGFPAFPAPAMVERDGHRVPYLHVPSSLVGRPGIGTATAACKGILLPT
jgi:hypothetical protein